MENNIDVNATENDNLDAEQVNVHNVNDNGKDIFNPRIWDSLEFKFIDLLAMKFPKRDLSIVNDPKDKSYKRFTTNLYSRVVSNGNKCDRNWSVYSKELDRVIYLCCKVFIKGIDKGQLENEDFDEWAHVGERPREHEIGMEHVKNMTTWYELR
ncbi:uncharacterized protein LOC127096301 [Lathyrus oleraceus]|uniref:uncharacterized protein LOC127096301 n=1 Tax=Pisum sativum TaxID=3888 RepID=UPI0021D04DB4|nr:uncharacterized protein LOC127096301 [Pisum sativum]